jgi:hypothetical protein
MNSRNLAKRIFTAILWGHSSSSERWDSELQREIATVFVDMGFCTSFLPKLCRFYISAATLGLIDPSFFKKIVPFSIVGFSFIFFF